MSEAEEQATEGTGTGWKVRVLAVEVGDSEALGGDVRLELSPGTTVLVGRNGAGKSLLLESIWAEAFDAITTSAPSPARGRFSCDAEIEASASNAAVPIRYLRRRTPKPETTDIGSLTVLPSVEVDESCVIVGREDRPLWSVQKGRITFEDGQHADIGAGSGLWSVLRRDDGQRAGRPLQVGTALHYLFDHVRFLPPGTPREGAAREELILPYPPVLPLPQDARRVWGLTHMIADWYSYNRERFDEFIALGRRTGLFAELKVRIYRDPDPAPSAKRRDAVSVAFDDVNIGLLSDGTLRTAEMLAHLVLPGTKLLLIEEPETAVHPGLLAKLLTEIEAYSGDKQVILSTQSPQVVSWAKPSDLRLVERRAGVTSVRGLREDEVARLSPYLSDEGTLGEFVYSGALDG